MLKSFHAAVGFFHMLPWFPGNWQPQSLLWYWEYLGDSYSNCESLANSFYKYSCIWKEYFIILGVYRRRTHVALGWIINFVTELSKRIEVESLDLTSKSHSRDNWDYKRLLLNLFLANNSTYQKHSLVQCCWFGVHCQAQSPCLFSE